MLTDSIKNTVLNNLDTCNVKAGGYSFLPAFYRGTTGYGEEFSDKYECFYEDMYTYNGINGEYCLYYNENQLYSKSRRGYHIRLEKEVCSMFDRLQAVEDRYDRLNELLSDPSIVNDLNKLREYSKEQSDIQDTVVAYREYKVVQEQIKEAKEMQNEKLDPEMRDMVKEELSELEDKVEEIEAKLKILLIPKDPNDDKNVIMEIRGAAGGDEAALFAADLYRMYSKFAEAQGWKTEVIDASSSGVGGYKEIIFMITGHGAYSKVEI